MRMKTVHIISTRKGFYLQTRVNGRLFKLNAKTSSGHYANRRSVQRAWQKFALANQIENYTYNYIQER